MSGPATDVPTTDKAKTGSKDLIGPVRNPIGFRLDNTRSCLFGVQTLPTIAQGATSVAPFFSSKKSQSVCRANRQSYFQNFIGHIQHDNSDSQKKFNPYPVRDFKLDVWFGFKSRKAQSKQVVEKLPT